MYIRFLLFSGLFLTQVHARQELVKNNWLICGKLATPIGISHERVEIQLKRESVISNLKLTYRNGNSSTLYRNCTRNGEFRDLEGFYHYINLRKSRNYPGLPICPGWVSLEMNNHTGKLNDLSSNESICLYINKDGSLYHAMTGQEANDKHDEKFRLGLRN